MLSRVADSLYWMSRNIERAENNARILSVHLIQVLEASEQINPADNDWDLLLEICASKADFYSRYAKVEVSDREIIDYLTFSKENTNSIFNCIKLARENARMTRDHLPDDLWEIWNNFYLKIMNMQTEELSRESLQALLQEIKFAALTAQGAVEASMGRSGAAYKFIKIGKWLERAEKCARILNVSCNKGEDGFATPKGNYYWRSALQLANGYNAYLKQYPPIMNPKNVLSFLMTDRSFPRSIGYCIDHVREAVYNMEDGKVSHYSRNLYLSLESLIKDFNEVKIKEVNLNELSQFLDNFQNQCNKIGKIFSETYYLIEPTHKFEKEHLFVQHQQGNMESRSFMKYEIEHINTFDYDTAVNQSMNTIRLKPRTDECQRLLSYRTEINPSSLTKEHVDLWGNHVETFFIPEQHNHLVVKSTSIVSIQRSPFIHRIEFSPEMSAIFHSELFRHHYLSFLNETEYTYLAPSQLESVVEEIGEMKNPITFSLDVMRYLHDNFLYNGEATHVETKAQESFSLKKGVCQDLTHVMIGILRENGIPARYVSGYLYVGENSALIGDSATHAWVEVMVPGIGWVGLDPTNNVEALENHIRVGTGRDYADVSPLQGVYRGGGHSLDVRVSVKLLDQ
ncbi:alpha-E domain-containing protein [Sediminibacillus massiliensis]|uniref:alpha-E domain-containing protein n=1 Tax=Sediminibacillus massiliensis TaxID=1926277 RepID=UPI00098878B3|nr:alpha-E domain-containing protein [Sediminibacillus massiliensis]